MIAFCVGKLEHKLVPILTSREGHQDNHRAREGSKVVLDIEVVLEHDPTEKVDG